VTSHPLQTCDKPGRTVGRLCQGSSILALVAALAGCSSDSPSEAVTRSSVPDPAGDVVVSGLGKDRQNVVAAPGNTITDIITTTVDHGADVVTIDVAFKNLRHASTST
jgi:hypothetical protein